MRQTFRKFFLVIVVATAAVYPSPAKAQRENAGPFEVQVGILVPTRALGTAEGYQVRLQAAPTLALAWHRATASEGMHTRAIVEATPYLSGRATPAAGCVGYCRPAGFMVLGISFGADAVLAMSREAAVPAYVTLGARGRAYVLATATCPLVTGAFCPGSDPLTEATVRPALALAVGAKPRVGARRLSVEVGYLPTWVRNGQVQHDFRATLGARF
ncbi:MAG: hypothetical protein ABR499_07985 [Gemmatimonadaceae bacterium]